MMMLLSGNTIKKERWDMTNLNVFHVYLWRIFVLVYHEKMMDRQVVSLSCSIFIKKVTCSLNFPATVCLRLLEPGAVGVLDSCDHT